MAACANDKNTRPKIPPPQKKKQKKVQKCELEKREKPQTRRNESECNTTQKWTKTTSSK